MRDGPHIYRHQILGKMMIIMDNPEWDIGVPHFRQTMTNPNHRIRCTCYLNNYKTKETLSMRSVQSGIHLDCLDFFTSKILTELQADVDRPPHIWRFSNHTFHDFPVNTSVNQIHWNPLAPNSQGNLCTSGLHWRWRYLQRGVCSLRWPQPPEVIGKPKNNL